MKSCYSTLYIDNITFKAIIATHRDYKFVAMWTGKYLFAQY